MGSLNNTIPIIQITGYKKSGKTSFIKKIIRELSEEGYRVGVIKHHGHGGAPDIIEPEHTDTAQFQNEGAYMTAVEGEGVLLMKLDGREGTIPLEQIVSMYQQMPLDLILIEGYKTAPYKKFLIASNEQELESLLEVSENVIGVIGCKPEEISGLISLDFNQAEEFTKYVTEEYLKRR
ncbi:molybdopterin-guanine dinucleotide biosynthesis protein B [Bacillus sp. Marseille-Q3570]|uniref:molybdopterin-guanine dinucleotide biosynthesis protein B n=1 Tax=Bacillus sp. Marseille-Q3570 TaxID=2963522 RepID=UPI0021B735BB|nr:molybdopterin-guanine dinucleotide biosynthesis protein B [Bacillus sp. Marseille-Q3570]